MPDYVYRLNRRTDMLPFVPPGADVLEVGCGRGGFAMGLREDRNARRLVGVEANPEAAAEARSYFDEVLCGYYPDVLDGRSDRFGCVVFNDVLEHMADPWEVLRRARAHLDRDGVVVACIPNARVLPVSVGLLRGDWRYEDQGVLDRTHLRFFTRRSIQRMFEESGYEIDVLEPINPTTLRRRSSASAAKLLRRVGPLKEFFYVQFAVRARPIGNYKSG